MNLRNTAEGHHPACKPAAGGLKLRLALWGAAWVAACAAYLGGQLKGAIAWLVVNPLDEITAGEVLFLLGLLWLYTRRKGLAAGMREGRSAGGAILAAIAVIAAALLLPHGAEWKAHYGSIFGLCSGLALFAGVFPRASSFALRAVAPGFAGVVVAHAIRTFAPQQAIMAPIVTGVPLLSALGLPVTHQGAVVQTIGPAGEQVFIPVTMGCSGHIGIGAVAGLFVLMSLDVRSTWKRSALVLAIGVAGAWVQNLLRLEILYVVGHFWGTDVMWTVHPYLSYVVFPAYYALFVFIWLRIIGGGGLLARDKGRRRPPFGPETPEVVS